MNIFISHTKNNKFLVAIFSLMLFINVNAQEALDTQKDLDYYFSLARKYKNQNKIQAAIIAIKKAADIAEKNENEKGQIDCFHQYAILYIKMNNIERSKFYWERTRILLNNVAYPYGSSVNTHIEAIYLHLEKNHHQALQKIASARLLNNNRNLLNNMVLTEANISYERTNYTKASINYNALIVNSDIYEKEYLATKGHLGMAKINIKDNPKESIGNALEALKIASKNYFITELLEANTLLTKAYEATENFNSSLQHSKKITYIKDSIFDIEKIKLDERTTSNIHSETIESQIVRLEKTNIDLEESKSRSESTNIVAFAILAIISLLAISLYRNNQIKIRTNTLLQKTNEELEIAKDEAIQAMEAKSNFLSTVSHELRTPLYAVTGLTNLLLEENPTENQKEHLKSLKFSGDYLLNFINDILQVNKIDAQKLETLKIGFNIKRTLVEVIDSLQQSAKTNNTKLLLDFDNKITNTHMGDPIKLSQILINLIGNAIKFTKNGIVTVRVNLLKKTDEISTIGFEVIDTGIGISEELQESIFDSFEQGSVQINREYGGTGLGLTIVKSLLGLFDSTIHLESKKGKGSKFSFELNIKNREDVIDDLTFEITEEEFQFEGLHILIVEDNKINQVITKKMLAKKEITSDIANNGMEAIELTKTKTYDAILMDIHMPGISGIETTIEIRKFNSEIPIIALTAISLDDSLDEFYAAGCNDVVTKPFKPAFFYQKIGENIFKKKNQ